MVPLLTLLLIGASAAAPTAEQAARDARMAIDRAQYDLAAKTIDDALRRFGSQPTEAVWTLRVMRAETFNATGKLADARTLLAGEPPPPLRNSIPAVRRHLELAYAWYGDTKELTKHLEEARRIALTHQPRVLAEVYAKFVAIGPEPKRAEEYAAKAIRESRRFGDQPTEARTMAALVYAKSREQRYADAVGWGEKALPLAQSLGLAKVAETTEGNVGWAYVELGDYDTAYEMFVRAEAGAARIGAENDRVAWLNQLGNLRIHAREWSAAERYYRQAVERGKPLDSGHVRQALANLAVVAIETGRLNDARRFNAEALALKQKTTDAESVLRSLIINARIAIAAGDLNAATAILRDVITKATHDATKWEARGRLAEVFVKANRFADAERQFRSAIETVREARQAIDNGELRLSFFNITADIFSAYIDFLVGQGKIAGALEATEVIRIDALDDVLEARTSLRVVDPRAIARQKNATLLSYWLGPRHSYVWTVTPASIHAARLAADSEITAAADAYRRDLIKRSPQLSRARGQQLYAMLGSPRGSRVIVIPDGALHALNFETLVVPSPRGPHYWIEDALITEASSIRVLEQQRPRRREGAPTMLLVGNPPSPDPAFPPLPRAADEMNSISRHFAAPRVKVLSGAAATPNAYRRASPGAFDYVHFVAHGVATRTQPLESAVILGRDATDHYKLLARDVVKQPLAARLVTISSCHGAGTRAYTGEGLVGLAWAFLRAGASSVIAALWEVSDSATPQLMDQLYAKTAAGADPAAALRDAKLSLLRSNSVYRYARYWAPFVYYE